jgi:hypothetical protein
MRPICNNDASIAQLFDQRGLWGFEQVADIQQQQMDVSLQNVLNVEIARIGGAKVSQPRSGWLGP